MVFDSIDTAALAGWSAFVIVTHAYEMRKEDRDWYNERKQKIYFSIPSWVFGIVWSSLCLLNIASIYLFNKFSVDPEHYTFVAVNVLFLVNQVLEMVWTPLFFRERKITWALIVAILISATAVVTVILMGLARSNIPVGAALAFILIGGSVHALWVSFAVVLNAMWVRSEGAGNELTQRLIERRRT